jgi:hypothetical protein
LDWGTLAQLLIRFPIARFWIDQPHDVAAGASEPIEQKSIIARFNGETGVRVNKTTGYLVYLRKSARSSIVGFLHYMFKNTARLASKTMSAQARTAPYTRAVVAAMRRL